MSGSHPVKFLFTIPARFTLQSGGDYEICLFLISLDLRARPHQQAIVEKHQPDVIGHHRGKEVHDEMFPLRRGREAGL